MSKGKILKVNSVKPDDLKMKIICENRYSADYLRSIFIRNALISCKRSLISAKNILKCQIYELLNFFFSKSSIVFAMLEYLVHYGSL